MDDIILTFGGACKALENGRVGGYLVRFSTPSDPDLTGEFFTPKTDFGVEFPGAKSAVYYNHGLDKTIGKRRLGNAEMKADSVGVWVEAQLNIRDRYEKAIYKLAQEGKLGWSSSTAPNLVETRQAGKATEITHWPLGLDASLTPHPAEPRNSAITLKSWQEVSPMLEDVADEDDTSEDNPHRLQISPEPSGGGNRAEKAWTPKEHSEQVVSACEEATQSAYEYAERLESRLEARMKSGRVLSQTNVDELSSVVASLEELTGAKDRLTALIERARTTTEATPTEGETPKAEGTDEFQNEADALYIYSQYQQTSDRLLSRVA